MKLLMDTHALIWWAIDQSQLSAAAWAAFQDLGNELLVSVASLWEMQIKLATGKMKLHAPLRRIWAEQRRINHFQLLPVRARHVFALGILPSLHRDPFDRLLVARTQVEGATLLTRDPKLRAYPVPTFWWPAREKATG